MKSTLIYTAFSLSLVALGACAAETGTTESETATESAASTVNPIVADPCPSKVPANGAACSDANLICSWGTDPRFGCRTEAMCESSKWSVTVASCTEPAPSCPKTAPTANDAGVNSCTAAESGLDCTYGDKTYACSQCNGNLCFTTYTWKEQTLPTGCPTTVPNFGQSCPGVANDTACNYNFCAQGYDDPAVFGSYVVCESGLWTAVTPPFACL